MIALTVAGDDEAAARTSATRISAAIDDARAERGVAHVALAGGRTPARTYTLLTRIHSDWRDVHLWLGDERCVRSDDPDANAKLIVDTLLAAVHPPPTFHPMRGADEDPTAAAIAYEQELREAVDGDPPRLDVALLGLGEDGHTASLFPNDAVLDEQQRLVVAVQGTKAPFARITMTLPMLLAARQIVVLAEGPGKAWAIHEMMAGPSRHVPASLLADGEVELIVDLSGAPA
ncbi:MAG: 6-phosphogluconolactonase [Conexibacter sp.]|nr:6-phosphogluconolactonase [Conexibacter sp.]